MELKRYDTKMLRSFIDCTRGLGGDILMKVYFMVEAEIARRKANLEHLTFDFTNDKKEELEAFCDHVIERKRKFGPKSHLYYFYRYTEHLITNDVLREAEREISRRKTTCQPVDCHK